MKGVRGKRLAVGKDRGGVGLVTFFIVLADGQAGSPRRSALIGVVTGQFDAGSARGRLQQVTLSVHDQPSVIRHRIVIIAERHRAVDLAGLILSCLLTCAADIFIRTL